MPEKARAVGVSFPPALHARVVERAGRAYGGNVSAYIQRLTEADLDNKLAALTHDPEVISNLCRTYAGYMAPQLARNLVALCTRYDTDQPAILHRVLQILADATEGEHPIDPEHMTITDDRHLEKLPLAAEDPGTYHAAGKPKPRRP